MQKKCTGHEAQTIEFRTLIKQYTLYSIHTFKICLPIQIRTTKITPKINYIEQISVHKFN